MRLRTCLPDATPPTCSPVPSALLLWPFVAARADPDAVPVPVLIDGSELAATFPLSSFAVDLAGLAGDVVPERPRLPRVHAPAEAPPELTPLQRLMADPLVTAFGHATVTEARDSADKRSYRGQLWQRPRGGT